MVVKDPEGLLIGLLRTVADHSSIPYIFCASTMGKEASTSIHITAW